MSLVNMFDKAKKRNEQRTLTLSYTIYLSTTPTKTYKLTFVRKTRKEYY